MGKWVHKLSNINLENMTADCANCGKGIKVKKTSKTPRCAVVMNEEKIKNSPKQRGTHGLRGTTAKALKEGNKCAICGSTDRLVIDHCHSTMKLRGILCSKCNQGLGLFTDSIEKLQGAIDYLLNPPGLR
jgi:hypothetical protein